MFNLLTKQWNSVHILFAPGDSWKVDEKSYMTAKLSIKYIIKYRYHILDNNGIDNHLLYCDQWLVKMFISNSLSAKMRTLVYKRRQE
jgi:hypothetical protein